MNDLTVKTGLCRRCGDISQAQLHTKFSANGASCFVWVCDVCKTHAPFDVNAPFIKKEVVAKHVSPEKIEALPVLMPEMSERCVVFHERTQEWHHWAPRALFKEESDAWPKDRLCKVCHDKWHRIVTPNISL